MSAGNFDAGDPTYKTPEKTSRWTEEERTAPVVPPVVVSANDADAPPPPPPWVSAFPLGQLIQHGHWWARISGYGQNEAGEIGCFIVPMHPTKKSLKR